MERDPSLRIVLRNGVTKDGVNISLLAEGSHL